MDDQLLQMKDEPAQVKSVADEALNLKDIFKTKIVVFGVIWTVFDWTIFIIVVAILIVATLVFCLFCCCIENSREEEEERAKRKAQMEYETGQFEKFQRDQSALSVSLGKGEPPKEEE